VKSLGVYGTGDLGRITASLCLKALLASRAAVSGAKKDEARFLSMSFDILRLKEENNQQKRENKALEDVRVSLKSENQVLTEKMVVQEGVIKKMQEGINLNESIM